MRYRRRAHAIDAYHWDGSNYGELARALDAHHPGARFSPSFAEPGEAYLLLGPRGAWWVEVASHFEATYEPAEEPQEPVTGPRGELGPRSCYQCVHYALSAASGGTCTLFNERIDSELVAAEDCLAYELPRLDRAGR